MICNIESSARRQAPLGVSAPAKPPPRPSLATRRPLLPYDVLNRGLAVSCSRCRNCRRDSLARRCRQPQQGSKFTLHAPSGVLGQPSLTFYCIVPSTHSTIHHSSTCFVQKGRSSASRSCCHVQLLRAQGSARFVFRLKCSVLYGRCRQGFPRSQLPVVLRA